MWRPRPSELRRTAASKVSFEDGQEGWVVRETAAFMEACAAEGQPFFAHVSLPKPHECYTPAQEFWDLYDPSTLTLPPNTEYDMTGKAPHLRAAAKEWRESDWPLFEPRTFEAARLRKLQGYLGNVSHVDHAVGELMVALDRLGLAESTIVIYSSDHGDYACEHDSMEKAPGICSDAITRVPMLWRWPGQFAAGHEASELVEAVDMVNTVCALVGLEAMQTADGKDISHLLRGEAGEVRRIAVTEFAWSKSVRQGRWRYVHYPREMFADEYPDGFGELYDLDADPWEMTNLFFEPQHAARVAQMRQELTDWLITTTRPTTILPAVPDDGGEQTIQRFGNAVNADGNFNPDYIRRARFRNYL